MPANLLGCDVGEPVLPDYGRVQIDIDAAAKDADRIIGAEERFNIPMARQK